MYTAIYLDQDCNMTRIFNKKNNSYEFASLEDIGFKDVYLFENNLPGTNFFERLDNLQEQRIPLCIAQSSKDKKFRVIGYSDKRESPFNVYNEVDGIDFLNRNHAKQVIDFLQAKFPDVKYEIYYRVSERKCPNKLC